MVFLGRKAEERCNCIREESDTETSVTRRLSVHVLSLLWLSVLMINVIDLTKNRKEMEKCLFIASQPEQNICNKATEPPQLSISSCKIYREIDWLRKTGMRKRNAWFREGPNSKHLQLGNWVGSQLSFSSCWNLGIREWFSLSDVK